MKGTLNEEKTCVVFDARKKECPHSYAIENQHTTDNSTMLRSVRQTVKLPHLLDGEEGAIPIQRGRSV